MLLSNHGILGINARNLLYIRPLNKKRAIRLADNKLKTKHFLSARGISVPKLYFTIRNRKELESFDFSVLPNSFVLKPNFGYGGEGIIPIVAKEGNLFLKANGEKLTYDNFHDHISDILDGRFSISNIADIAFFEQRVICEESIGRYSYQGLPDIRVVVYNLVPVMAMLRLPTKESDGKANLHLGAVGVGIDLAKGTATFIVKGTKIIDEIPGIGDVKGLKIPYWDEILLIASRIQLATNLGYLAADIVLDKNVGPVLLEINARAGLGVQVANLAPLRRRLEKIKGVKVSTPVKGVRLAQDMFGEKIERNIKNITGKQVIGSEEDVEVILKDGIYKLSAEINPALERTVFDRNFAKEKGLIEEENEKAMRIKFVLGGVRIVTMVDLLDLEMENKKKMIIGKRDLRDFLIDPSKSEKKKMILPKDKFIRKPKKEFNYYELDHRLLEMENRIKLLFHLKPYNLREEEQKFLLNNNYNPQFSYPSFSFNFYEIKRDLVSMQFDDSSLGRLFADKRDEIKRKIELLEEVGSNLEFTENSVRLYGAPSGGLVWEAEQLLKDMKEPDEVKLNINDESAKEIFTKVLTEYGLNNWKVKIKDSLVTDCLAGKRNALFIRKGAVFSERRIKSLIVHEIETHILTAENGKQQPYKLFNRGLADYLVTQEGLAVYNTEQICRTQNRKHLLNPIAVYTAMHGSFVDVFNKMRNYFVPIDQAFRIAVKVKRGLEDTSLPGAFTKDFVYFKGLKEIQNFVYQKGDLKRLYIGKINLADLELIAKVPGLVKPKYLPKWMR